MKKILAIVTLCALFATSAFARNVEDAVRDAAALEFGMSDFVDNATASRLGDMAGAQFVVVGSFNPVTP